MGTDTILYILPELGFPVDSDSKESICNVEDLDLIPESGRSPGGGCGNPLQCFLLGEFHVWRLQSMGLQRVGHD